MKKFVLSEQEINDLAKQYSTPFVVLSLNQVIYNYNFLLNYLPSVKIHYAVKSNPNKDIIRTLADLGSNFDVASDGEMIMLTEMGIEPSRMIYANPFKTPIGLETAKRLGVTKFTFDSESEIYKMAKIVPNAIVLLRVRLDKTDAKTDLNKKFGADPKDAIRLLTIAKEQGLDVGGLCFHVGSNSASINSYINAVTLCRRIFYEAKEKGIELRILDIGGGFTPLGDVESLLSNLFILLQGYFPDIEIWSEPGRFICNTTMNLVTSVIGITERNNNQWYFLDEGLYGVFTAIPFDHWKPEFITFKNSPKTKATFAGPSCDSLDILMTNKYVEELEVGDLILVPDCGAYTTATATTFNGFSKAQVIVK
jgi:ornithine decarboxylase